MDSEITVLTASPVYNQTLLEDPTFCVSQLNKSLLKYIHSIVSIPLENLSKTPSCVKRF